VRPQPALHTGGGGGVARDDISNSLDAGAPRGVSSVRPEESNGFWQLVVLEVGVHVAVLPVLVTFAI
jgi:hypothetical protein